MYHRVHVRNIFSHLSSSVSFRVTRWYDGDGCGFFGPTSSTRDQLFEETNEEKKSEIHISLLSRVLNVKKWRSSSKISTTCSNAMNECCTVWTIIVTWNRTWHQTGIPYGHTCINVHTSFHNCLQCEQSSIVSRSLSLGNVGICRSSLNYRLAPGEETNKRRSVWIVYFLLS